MGRELNEYNWHIEWRDPNDLIPYEGNAKKHDGRNISNIAASIKRYGWQSYLVVTKGGIVIIGHGRRLAAIELGCRCPCKVIEDDLTDAEIRELRDVDNLTQDGQYDLDKLRDDFNSADLDFSDFDFLFGEHEDLINEIEGDEANPYSPNVKIPQYEITGSQPSIAELYDSGKPTSLIVEIEAANISDEEKEFLKYAAYRHTVFNFKNIAEYYANASAEMQQLMEKSALVIIDLDDAIANGYAKLDEGILSMVGEDEDDA